ncbi:thiol-disulfide oxidoreductase DCC family protein [Sinomicrobium weinanense]|uniref:Thiol-disulfide oxidoreductase DCC family protein n=1 Tax=Sinomicrobium weinanense TaxID=2842200 RepID=A0A926JTI1_9FLAO|nr:thiol-disulfide oxidoreductase DCC family protein [Sinomicrobium weinanense]MBC9797086.1 thiol-disulfide oxidoreductase DCC family protein [Sinomicrobium weinanense]MBU3122685.1 thiol-disulfide oxidoreductase DCC family protein [Sinomicrobium weinanense]
MDTLEKNKKLILFDGVCNLCNSSVQFVIKRDKKDIFRFAALQSELGQKLLKERGIIPDKTDSIIVIEPDVAYYTRSQAAIEIASEMGGGWPLLRIFQYIPRPLRDSLYNLIAKNRYNWFGRKDQCMIPTPELKAKFLG